MTDRPNRFFDHPVKKETRRFIEKLKVLELAIDSLDFDYPGMGTEIDRYCLHNDVPPRTRYRIRLAFEELTQQILKDVLKQNTILLTIEYSQRDEKTGITAVYGGGRFDPADSGDRLSYSLLKGSVDEFSYEYDPQAERSNIIRVVIRE